MSAYDPMKKFGPLESHSRYTAGVQFDSKTYPKAMQLVRDFNLDGNWNVDTKTIVISGFGKELGLLLHKTKEGIQKIEDVLPFYRIGEIDALKADLLKDRRPRRSRNRSIEPGVRSRSHPVELNGDS